MRDNTLEWREEQGYKRERDENKENVRDKNLFMRLEIQRMGVKR